MQLKPRRVINADSIAAWKHHCAVIDAGVPGGVLPRFVPSIWAMELPNESYWAPRMAFWWVSNEPTK